MSSVRKFTFDVSFDDGAFGPSEEDGAQAQDDRFDDGAAAEQAAEPDPEPEPEPEPEAPTYSEEELQLAREDAYVAGHAAALEEASVVQGRALAEAVQSVAAQLPGLQGQIADINGEIGELAARVAIDVCRKLLPHCPEDYAAREISALVQALLPSLANQPRLVVRVGPSLSGATRRVLDGMAERSGFDGRIVVLDDHGLGEGEARVEWADGGAERNTSRLWAEVDALVERNIPRFSRAEALELPEPEPEPEPAAPPPAWDEDDIWPDIDASAYWAPPEPMPEEPEAFPEQEDVAEGLGDGVEHNDDEDSFAEEVPAGSDAADGRA